MKKTAQSRSISGRNSAAKIEVCILAGGLSSRMGRNKSKLRLGGKTLLAHIRNTAESLHLPVRVIRRDIVRRCGPLGGIYTALKTTSSEAVLFLACDMPLVSVELLERLLRQSRSTHGAVVIWDNNTAGFPLLLNRKTLSTVEKLLAEKRYSLQTLAREVRARKFRPGRLFKSDLLNVNTPADWAELKSIPQKSQSNF
jgi:molybdopterin-guanine dinucleotide biosynthesis protein A